MSELDPKERPGTIEVEAVQIVEDHLDRPPPPLPGGTVEVQAVQILEERSRRPPPPLLGGTVEVQAVQILEERASVDRGKAQAVRPEEEQAPTEAPIFRLTAEEVDWRRLDPLEADLLVRFTFGATIDAVVRASGVDPDRARGAINRLIRAGLLVR